jgi:hypothetical protein
LHDVARNPKNLGATIGFSCVLHSWTQTLLFHPHIHCIVTGGGLDPDRHRWIAARRGFLFPVRILAQLFRAKLLRRLESGLNDKTLCSNDVDPHAQLRAAARKDWVVYSKPPFAGPRQVLQYLGRYTHRVAISNHRLVSLDHGRVTFHWNDRARGNPKRLMTLDVQEFLRRFLLHILPSGLMRIRHYGLLANELASTIRTTSRRERYPLSSMPNRPPCPGRLAESGSTPSTVRVFPGIPCLPLAAAAAVDAPVCLAPPRPDFSRRSAHHHHPHQRRSNLPQPRSASFRCRDNA